MSATVQKFAELLTLGVHRIRLIRGQKISIIQDELGQALGKSGGSMIEHWRKGNLPANYRDVEQLAREIVGRSDVDKAWLTQFLASANFPWPSALIDELFPKVDSDIPADYEPEYTPAPGEMLPQYRVPAPAPLPAGSIMPFHRNPHFVGRHDNLLALAEALNYGFATTISQIETAAATGLGGIGKTQLAVEFVHRYGQFFQGGVFWLSFESPDAVPSEIAACGEANALALKANFGQYTLNEQVKLVQAAWSAPEPRLLIFDNCEDPRLLLKWRPRTGGCRVLVTSRRGDWKTVPGVRDMPLGVLTRAESIRLLRKHRPDIPKNLLSEIAKELGDLPLALHLAGSYLRYYRRSADPIVYLEQLRDPLLLHHPSMRSEALSMTGHVQHVGRTFALSYEKLNLTDENDTLAHRLLVNAAHFAPGEPIWYELLVKTLTLPDHDELAAFKSERAFRRLIEIGLIETEENNTLRMHRLVARFVRDVANEQLQHNEAAVEKVVYEYTRTMNRAVEPLPLLARQHHLRAVVDIAKIRNEAESASLCYELGMHLWQISDYSGAQPYLEKALTMREEIFGPGHPTVAESLVGIGRVLRAQGRYEEAKAYFERSLAIRQQQFGDNHADTAESLENLGESYRELGDPRTGSDLIARALTIVQAIHGEEHPLTGEYNNNLAHCYYLLGQKQRATTHFERALAINRRVLGEMHAHTALNKHNLGIVHRNDGNFVAAQQLLESALEARRKLYGDHQADTANTANALAQLYLQTEQLENAQLLANQSMAALEEILPEIHEQKAATHITLGQIHEKQGDRKNASRHFQAAYNMRLQLYGEADTRTIELLRWLS
ncbi:MAG: tetratricopeptide repeat protein [Anaerolineales bacterium]|nr:tetratricopeptide repeat protein [Anaerolineales bacterium]